MLGAKGPGESLSSSSGLGRRRRYVDQGGGKRKGAFAIYIEPWHADIFDFLDLRKNHGKEEARARALPARARAQRRATFAVSLACACRRGTQRVRARPRAGRVGAAARRA